MTASLRQATPVRKKPEAASKLDASCMTRLIQSVQKYLDLMYDCDTSRFDDVFYPSVHLHGFRDGKMVAWSAETYRDILNTRQSPKSINAPREDEILLREGLPNTFAQVGPAGAGDAGRERARWPV